jgi:type III restriction enzyme
MILKGYQKTAVDKLVKINKKLLEKEGQRVCVFKAPTGSGKTIMVAEFLNALVKEHLPSKYAFIWISGYNLHKQSRKKIESYLVSSPFTFSYLEDIQGNEFSQNEIVFVNWHSLTKQDKVNGEFTNIFMRENETDRNLPSYIENSKEKGLDIVLLVDESHYHYWSDKSQQLVQNVINPKLTIEISATPKLEPTNEEIEFEEAGKVTVRFEDVIAEGMIKTNVVVNMEIENYKDFRDVADDVIINAAILKQDELINAYKKIDKVIVPLVLIQLPNESETTSALDRTKLEYVEKYLADKFNITIDNHLLGIWLSENERKKNLENIEANNNEVRVLIFKQAIALGWDCPRAHILVMFRDIKNPTFEIQTVGRILRMPEAEHYTNDVLNQGYVYTNLDRIQIAHDNDSPPFFNIKPSHRKTTCEKLSLPSVYLRRIDYGDLTLTFRRIFIQEACKYFGINENDTPDKAKKKVDKKLELLPSELTQALISDAVIKNIDNIEDVIGKIIHFSVSEDDIKFKYEYFAKACSLPYAPIRSHTKIQQAIYDWFDNFLGYEKISRLEIQRIVVCSSLNQRIFKEIIETAKEKFKILNIRDKESKQSKSEYSWDIPVIDYFNELYVDIKSENYSMDKCYVLKKQSLPEETFEGLINNNLEIKWWYKNGAQREIYFSILYKNPEDNELHSFYPDYIVKFNDGRIGIFDTKSGITKDSNETKAKSDALQVYIQNELKQGRKIFGGIVDSRRSGLFFYTGPKYVSDVEDKHWERVNF